MIYMMKRLISKKLVHFLSILAFFSAIAGGVYLIISMVVNSVEPVADTSSVATTDPDIKLTDLVSNLDSPMSVAYPNSTAIFYALKSGDVRGRILANSDDWLLVKPVGVNNENGFGLLSIAVDTEFVDKPYLYACYTTANDLRVTRYAVSQDLKSTTGSKDILTGVEIKSSDNVSCAMTMDASGTLWIGTGDSGIASAPQNPKSLAGKILRLSREGIGVGGNLKSPFDDRIFSYGHRKVTSIALVGRLLDNAAFGYSIDQGGVSDEVNYLLPKNFGYNPDNNGSYNPSAAMTDKARHNDAVDAVWSTPDGSMGLQSALFIKASRWQAWQNKLLVSTNKDSSSIVLEFDEKGAFKSQNKGIKGSTGQLIGITEAPDLTLTGVSGTGKIIQIKVICTVCG